MVFYFAKMSVRAKWMNGAVYAVLAVLCLATMPGADGYSWEERVAYHFWHYCFAAALVLLVFMDVWGLIEWWQVRGKDGDGAMRKGKTVTKVLVLLVVLCVLNFVSFAVHSTMDGGGAVNGRVENGRYYVSNHGVDTELSEQAWRWNLWHSRSLVVTHPLAMFLMIILGAPHMNKKWERAAGSKTSFVK